MGLLDDFGEFIKTPEGQGVLGATFGGLSTAGRVGVGPLNSLGIAGLSGLQGYQTGLNQQREQMQTKALDVDMQTKKLALDRQKRLEDAYKSFYANRQAASPTVPGPLSGDGSGANAAGLLGGANTNTPDNSAFPRQPMPSWLPQKPTPAVAPMAAPAPAAIPSGAPAANQAPVGNDNYARHLQFAQYLDSQGLGEEAQKYYDLAEKFKPKINSQKTLLQNGKPVNVITYDDGTQKVSDFGALPDVQILNLGGKQVVVDKNTAKDGQTFVNSMTPGEVASNNLGWANYGLNNRKFGFEQQQAAKPQYHDGFWVTPPTKQNPNGTVIAPAANNKEREANDVLSLIGQAEPLLDASTGSYGGVAVDKAAQFFGGATDGAKAAAQLKVLGGALVSKMPKMSGPQSDKDVLLYKEMAGQIGDPTVPAEMKKAAIQTIREINQRYSTGQGGMPVNQQPSNIPDAAVQMLKSNPSLYRAQFDKKYGAGAAASILEK